MISIVFAVAAEQAGCVESIQERISEKKRESIFVIKIYKYSLWVVLSALPLIILSGFRQYEIGTDTKGTYLDIFYLVQNGRSSGIRDKGYALLNKVSLIFTQEYTGVLLLTAMIIGAFIFKAIYEQSVSPAFSIFLYVATSMYFNSMNVMRQTIATAIFLYALKYVKEKKAWKYYILIALASTIHLTAIIYIPIYFWDRIKITKGKIMGGLLLLLILQSRVGGMIYALFSRVKVFQNYFAHYYISSYNNESFNIWSFLVEAMVLLLLLVVYNQAKEDLDYRLFLFLEVLSVAILLLSTVVPLAQRISWMFSFSKIIFLPKMIRFVTDKKLRIAVYGGVVTGFILYTYITVMLRGYNEVIPYQSIFSSGGM